MPKTGRASTCNKLMLPLFILCSILLAISYYDASKLLNHPISLTSIERKENISNSNHTEEVTMDPKIEEKGFPNNITTDTIHPKIKEQSLPLENKTDGTREPRIDEENLPENNQRDSTIDSKMKEPGLPENNKTGIDSTIDSKTNEPGLPQNNKTVDERYLVSSSKCKIINLSPFSQEANKYFKPVAYKNCTDKDMLTYVIKKDNIATVHIDTKVIPQYTRYPILCSYADATRRNSTDFGISLTDFKAFEDNVTITQEAIFITCTTKKNSTQKIYENVHASITITENIQKKINYYNTRTDKPISILFVGIDSISRLNFIRSLPKTYRYVEDNGWIPLKGYNKIADNTFPNVMAMLAGFNESTAFNICDPRVLGLLDKCPMLWYKYRDLNYVTGYGEDESILGTFTYGSRGYINPPTDYYFRPYIMATEKLSQIILYLMAYCTGPQMAGERMFDVVKDFGGTFKETPHFGFFWMNSFSHNDLSQASMMDDKLKEFLTDLEISGVTNNSLIIFLSDHGIRFGGIRTTLTGWLEERLPFIYFSFPPWFKDKFPTEYRNFKNNINKLTTPYDIYMTLQHILTMSGLNHIIKPSDSCPKCVSLFEEVPEERSCEEAGIEDHWCTCAGYSETKLDASAEKKVSNFFVNLINKMVSDHVENGADKCVTYTADGITTRVTHKFSYKSISYALVTLKTRPKAIFETTISYNGDIMNNTLHAGSVSRLDFYRAHSQCVDDANLKKYCYCA